jgi:hypothetical protein
MKLFLMRFTLLFLFCGSFAAAPTGMRVLFLKMTEPPSFSCWVKDFSLDLTFVSYRRADRVLCWSIRAGAFRPWFGVGLIFPQDFFESRKAYNTVYQYQLGTTFGSFFGDFPFARLSAFYLFALRHHVAAIAFARH